MDTATLSTLIDELVSAKRRYDEAGALFRQAKKQVLQHMRDTNVWSVNAGPFLVVRKPGKEELSIKVTPDEEIAKDQPGSS
ncbi:MAG: hypothetical protein QXI19_07715 [Candidatus Caldarchaeum sp.]